MEKTGKEKSKISMCHRASKQRRKMETIKEATGAAIRPHDLSYETILYASDFGAAPKKSAVENTQAINQAILAASKQGGATVVIAKGE